MGPWCTPLCSECTLVCFHSCVHKKLAEKNDLVNICNIYLYSTLSAGALIHCHTWTRSQA